ncbi:MAG: hypothetical protein KAJ33_04405 [Thermoplasmata archaeon]|nr:hypothetical protein [Thermoplasmata archaeon]MCK5397469.1 hypothetical protein [Thermoplasmata archaeon]
MTDEIEYLAKRIRDRPDNVLSVSDLASELQLPELQVARDIKDIVKRDGFFDIGDHSIMFTGNTELAAFEIFKTAAANITFDEFIKHQEQPHLLMRLSRDRTVACKNNPEKLLQDAIKEKEINRGNTVS